jgi:hypothetical protein
VKEGEIGDAEKHDAGADSQGGRKYRESGESGLLAEGARGESGVLRQIAQPTCDPRSARFFLLNRGVPELPACSVEGILLGHTVLQQFRSFQFKV